MKTLLIALSLLVATTTFTKTAMAAPPLKAVLPAEYVYIDNDPKEPYYHSRKECDGVKGHKVQKVTLNEAVNKYHLKPCPECYKPKNK